MAKFSRVQSNIWRRMAAPRSPKRARFRNKSIHCALMRAKIMPDAPREGMQGLPKRTLNAEPLRPPNEKRRAKRK